MNFNVWNPNVSNQTRQFSIKKLFYEAQRNTVLFLDKKEFLFVGGAVGNTSHPGIRITASGSGVNYSNEINNFDLKRLGLFRLYVDSHVGSISFIPDENLFRYLGVKSKIKCD